MYFCGLKLYGTQTDVHIGVAPGIGSSINVDKNGVPYVVNVRGDVYSYQSGVWTRQTEYDTNVAEVKFGRYNKVWAMAKNPESPMSSVIAYPAKRTVTADASKMSLGPYDAQWIVDSAQQLKR